ncbi:MAG: hypothetical protein HY553_13485 [Elusimicrobia bacterium]|nr:hypothetical protein [Elusimicrobiota bacterium]
MTLFSTLGLAAALAFAVAGQEPGLLGERELKLTLQPVALDLHRDGRIREVRFAFVPFGLRTACQGKFVTECRKILRDKGIAGYSRRRSEPEQILDVKVGKGKPELLEKLAVDPVVKGLREKVDVTWTAAGTPKEYTLDRKRVVNARVRWRVFVNVETLDVLDVLK